MEQKVFRSNAKIVKHENNVLVGVLFHFDVVSKNYTMVRSGAKVRATSDAILRKHSYPLATDFFGGLAGRILRYYTSEDGKAFMADFVLFDEAEKQKVLSGELAFSVAWIAELYGISDDNYIFFDDVTIYETSLVDNPAFNTCAAENKEGLTCLNSACGCGGKNSACGCGGKNETESKEESKKDYISAMEQQILDAIAALKEELAALAERVSAIEAKMATPPAEASSDSEAVEALQAQVAEHQSHFEKLNKQFDELLKAVSDFVEKTSKSLRYV